MGLNFPTPDWLANKFSHYYSKYEDFILKEERNEDLKILKKILVYYIPFLLAYFILLPFFNPYLSFTRGIVSFIGIIVYYFMLRVKNFTIAVVYILSHAIFTLYTCSKNPPELLRSIGMILVQHNQAMVINQHKKLGFIFIVTSMVLVYRSQDLLNQFIEQNDFEQVKVAIRGLQFTWPLLYLMNTSFIINVTKRYCKAIHENREVQTELEAKNQELFGLNEKLKATLSLLEQKNKELKEAINARELFIASVSHELRNPLNSMLGNIELLNLEVKDARWIKMLDACKICGEVLLGLINNVLDVAKINAERLELNIQTGNLHRLIENVWVISTVKMRQKGIKGHLAIGSNVPKYIEMDTHRLNQILLNLIGNATKFTKEGFVKVLISWQKDGDIEDLKGSGPEFTDLVRQKAGGIQHSDAYLRENMSLQLDSHTDNYDWTDNSTLEDLNYSFSSGPNHRVLLRSFRIKSLSQLRLGQFHSFDEYDVKIQDKIYSSRTSNNTTEKGILKIEIIDSGCGISRTALHRLFQPFSQADSSITRCFGGTGLGLYITKELVHKMKGHVGVESQKNVGSSFWMVLPSKNNQKPESEEEGDSVEASSLNSRNLIALVVDDDPLNQIIMTSYLKKLNIKADIANNGYEALQKFKEKVSNYYCLITMDIMMPIMDGISACKAIRRYENEIQSPKNVPIIMVSANCIDFNKHQCLDPNGEIKASYFFRKPFKFEECQTSITALLNKTEKRKVLIVDDDMFNRDVLREYLEKYSFECEVCVNGREAVSKVNERKYDVILMDCEMPEMNGYTAAKLIRGKYPRLPIIGVTGNTREDCLQKAKASGMNDVESKPVNFQNLVKNIKKLL